MSENNALRKTLLLVKRNDETRVKQIINEMAAFGWQRVIEVRPICSQKLAKKDVKARVESNTSALADEWVNGDFDKIFSDKDFPLDIVRLKTNGIACRVVDSVRTLRELVKDDLQERNLYWLNYAKNEYKKSSIPHLDPEEWAKQFTDLGHKFIGQHLLKSLQVIHDAELKAVFKMTAADKIGLQIVHGYIKDEEPGSSSAAVKHALAHMYPVSDIVEIDLAAMEKLTKIDADLVYIYEDGLWSGVELIKRLTKIWQSEHFKKSNLQLHFKYAVTSDAGLAVARLFAKREGLARFQFFPAQDSHHFTFIKGGVDSRFKALTSQDDTTIRKAVDAVIEPYAFRPQANWGDERENAIAVCAEIGSQLIKPFLEREKAKKGEEITVTEEVVQTWCLGAAGFASTIVFASSIPKPVLPLLWLNGRVNLGGREINWRPLFWDARRTGEAG
jgi:hypothetical protein